MPPALVPPRQYFISITIPNGIVYEMVTHETHPGWHEADCRIAKSAGDQPIWWDSRLFSAS